MIRDDVPESIALAEPGLYRGVPAHVYHARVEGLVSKSALDKVERSPVHYKAWVGGAADDESPSLDFGSAFHAASLEPDEFARIYTVEPRWGDCRKKENKARRDDWRAANEGKKLLEAGEAEAIRGMVRSMHAHPLASKMIADGEPELTLRWNDEETGLLCKGRADYYIPKLDLGIDVKTSEDARPDAFARSVARYGYHKQDAMYRDGFAAVGHPLAFFVFLVIEKRPPYAIALYTLDDDAVSRGRAAVRLSMNSLADCIERGEYPGYSPSIETLSLPRWA